MVSASKDLMKITGTYSKAYVQGYFKYDSKKSGGVTICNMRFGENPIRSTYYVDNAKLVVCTKDSYLDRFKMFDLLEKSGMFLLNTSKTKEEILSILTKHDKDIIIKNKIKFLQLIKLKKV